ncbi:MAG TPA: glutamate-5-semialdehyde dehydrogenase [Polyangiaceae bacterium LLY-WYZ-14_1]|nr:glutamate-5-semialdehyde dehydrogenase [Polyangiaceae bacterium LLY-WYZ-14_1]
MTSVPPRAGLEDELRALAQAGREAARQLAGAGTEAKNAALAVLADRLDGDRDLLLEANREDLARAEAEGLSPAMVDRLRLTPERLAGIAEAVRRIGALPDPVGAVRGTRRLPNGLEVGRMRVPLGLIAVVYESRPNVTVDAAALCLKSGNAVILRGGKEAFASNQALARLVRESLVQVGLPAAAATLVPSTDREATRVLLRLDDLVDLAVPRGGEGLIRFVTEHARVPVIKHYKGVCHVYVDGAADLDMAQGVVLDAKTNRPGTCNAMETLLVDEAVADVFVPRIAAALGAAGVEVRGDPGALARSAGLVPATEADWDTEHLSLIANLRVVQGLEAAMDHIARHGTRHTEAIVTEDLRRARRFQREVDASLVLVNASTRFNDGGELGLGAELGVSTTKLHAYGPMGLEELCAEKWVGVGEGQRRGAS